MNHDTKSKPPMSKIKSFLQEKQSSTQGGAIINIRSKEVDIAAGRGNSRYYLYTDSE